MAGFLLDLGQREDKYLRKKENSAVSWGKESFEKIYDQNSLRNVIEPSRQEKEEGLKLSLF